MSNCRPNTLEICRTDLFTKEDELRKRYGETTITRILRIRDAYSWFISNPDAKDRQFVEMMVSRYGIGKTAAYSDLAIVKALLPHLSQASRDFHRYRYNEMILETYQMARKRKDTKTMEKAASSYAKFNRVDDPSVLGIKPMPRLQERIQELLQKYQAENIDIEDIEFEEADLEEKSLFPDDNGIAQETNIL